MVAASVNETEYGKMRNRRSKSAPSASQQLHELFLDLALVVASGGLVLSETVSCSVLR